MLTPPATAMHPPINLIPAHRQDQASRFVDVEILESRQVINTNAAAPGTSFGCRSWPGESLEVAGGISSPVP